MSRPLEGVKVLDLTQAYSGPFCTMHLADMGAEVIKIESPNGDQSRAWGPFKNDYSAYYSYINRNKKGIVLDLKSPEGKKILWELIAEADVLCENFKVGTFEKLGFTYEEMQKVNPRIIYGSISGFGLEGPLASRPCYDIIAQAMSGMMSVTGHVEHPCVKIGPSIGDNYSGTYLSLGICMALYQREKTGLGQRLDIAMLDTLYSVMENFVITYTVGGEVPSRMGNADSGIAPFDSFRAKDGDFVMGCGTDRMWANLCKAMGREELIEDPRYKTNDARCRNYLPDLKKIVEDWSTTKTVAELEEIITGISIPFGQINNIADVSNHPQIKARNMLWKVYDPGMDAEISIPGTPIKMHGTPDEIQKAAPQLGEDTEAVLAGWLGYSKEDIDKARQNKAFG